MATVEVKLNQQTASLPVVMLEGNGFTLFGQNWLLNTLDSIGVKFTTLA